jgi:DNA-binding NtrC family response regulator
MNISLVPRDPILIVDDEPSALDSFEMNLRANGLNNIICHADSRVAAALLETQEIEIVLLDLEMPFLRGEEFLKCVKDVRPETPVIIITGNDTVESAVRCMKQGAFDYLVKPIDESRLVTTVRRALEIRDLRRENHSLRYILLKKKLNHPQAFNHILTRSKDMHQIFQYMEGILHSRQPLLITGESGVGKELIARAAHNLLDGAPPFVCVNVAGLDDFMFSDTLFGHVKGAFTGATCARRGLVEQAAGGILFLDEIGDLSRSSQTKLLRLIQEQEYFTLGTDTPRPSDVRIIAATHVDLDVDRGQIDFRSDLFYRLCVHRINIPPLRERREDIRLLAEHFRREAIQELKMEVPDLPDDLDGPFSTYTFPGNIRELRSLVFEAVGRSSRTTFNVENFFKLSLRSPSGLPRRCPLPEKILFPEELPFLKDISDQLIDEALKRTHGNQTAAGRMIGLSQPAMSKRIKIRKTAHSDPPAKLK